jgi:membrane fusion protein (multidrug efflux system)
LSFKREIFLKKQMLIMLVSVALIFSLIFSWKYYQALGTQRYLKSVSSPIVTVSTMKVTSSLWQPKLKAVGSLRARVGVNVTTELAGMVQTIYFTPGAEVTKGQVLVQLNAAAEIGLLHSLEAQVELAKITYQRDKLQFAAHAVAKQVVDTDEWNLKKLQAQVEEQNATVQKKTIRAPFTGRLGINDINPGQYLNVADKITTLQALDPIYADFFLPQQALAQLKLGQAITVTIDTFPGRIFYGKITTIQPAIDTSTRNVEVEATLPNPKLMLTPGMFAHVEVDVASPTTYITVPQSAISFNPYGDIAYIVLDEGKKDNKNQPIITVRQVFVTVGETRGDQITILKGLKTGDTVVTSGQLKLKNGSRIAVNNNIQPSNQAAPKIIEK